MIISPDPDILILLLHHRQNIATKEIFVHTRIVGLNTDLNPYMPIYKLYDILTKKLQTILLPVFCLGVIPVMFSQTKGRIHMQRADKFQALQDLGFSAHLLDGVHCKACRKFT